MTHPAAAAAETADLVRRSRRGDRAARAAFAELIRRHERAVLAVAYAITTDAAAAGDVAQETFLRAWQELGGLEDAERFGAWLCGIARNRATDARRARQRRPTNEMPADAADESPGPAAEAERRETADRLDAALRRLDDVSRCAVALRYYDGLSSADIAALLDLTPAAVDMRLARARQTLRELLGRCGIFAGDGTNHAT